ncbi:MAG: BamA/TamA family outer membrane protein [Candidatus Adiutrix sp.]|jgi:translocation and assembly module TamA|nr:BamA/TamA family outer membrane protein [Candidatus Adiutrix sp.]
MNRRATLCLTVMLALTGCGPLAQEQAAEQASLRPGLTAPVAAGPALHATIPAPAIPADLKARAGQGTGARPDDGQKYGYTLDCESPEAPELAEIFEKTSRLALMKDEPASRATLEQRLAVSLGEGRNILQSQGYYEGRVEGHLTAAGPDKLKAVVTFAPGPLYRIGAGRVTLAGPLTGDSQTQVPPQFLSEVGLEPGQPAVADQVLAAVSRVEEAFHNLGYPEATIDGTKYILDRSKRTLDAEVQVSPQPFARMGRLEAPDGATVDQTYLEALRTWEPGQPWNQELLDNYLSALRQTGLFQSVEALPAPADGADGLRPILIKLAAAPERTIGGQVSYDTDFGPGLTGYWEHRNLTGHGDRLRVDLPLWQDLQELTASYRYPYFLRPDQDIIAKGGLLHEDSDAYVLTSGSLAAGLERRLTPQWRVSAMGAVEGGSLKDPGQDSKDFMMLGLPVTAAYDSTGSLLDPTRGVRLIMLAAPYTGRFHEDFNVIRTRLEGQAFIPLGSERLVLALRGLWASLWGADNSQDVPSALRFYSGGGGSVRGYDYQSVGPRNAQFDPLGGVSQVEVGAETRWRFTEDMGLVAFLDGGMVYENVDDKLFQDMLWGTGLGFRYYTAIGPVRADVAFPLQRRDDDDSWQLYLSLGQSF